MSFDIVGNLHKVFDTQVISDKFKKREFVLEIKDGNYTQFIKFQLTQNRCELLNDFSSGQNVQVSFSITGRPYENKNGETLYFNNLNAWRIVLSQSENELAPPSEDIVLPEMTESDDPDEELPF